MRAESTGRKKAPVLIFTLNFSSGRIENGRVRFVVVVLGIWRREGVSVARLGCGGRVGFGTSLSGSESGRRTAADAIVITAVRTVCNIEIPIVYVLTD